MSGQGSLIIFKAIPAVRFGFRRNLEMFLAKNIYQDTIYIMDLRIKQKMLLRQLFYDHIT
jgi:hypothetical protein